MDTMIIARIPWTEEEYAKGQYVDEPFLNLAAAIIKRTVKDYVKNQRDLWNLDFSVNEKRIFMLRKIEIEDFVYSEWYEWLTDIDPDKLLIQCRVMAKEKEKSAREKQNEKAIQKMIKENA